LFLTGYFGIISLNNHFNEKETQMEKKDNPYSPGAGRIPFALAGREVNLELFEVAATRIENGLDARSMVFYGLRGVGKTVLLRDLYFRIKKNGWVTAFIEANPEKRLRQLLAEELETVVTDLAKPNAGEAILKAVKTALSFVRFDISAHGDFSLGVDLSSVNSSNAGTGNISGDLNRLIRDLSVASEKNNKGIALFFDEAQDMNLEDLRAINEMVHRANQERYRLIVAIAGLPTLPGKLSESTSYSERLYSFSELKELDNDSARTALTEPSIAKNVHWNEDAIQDIIDVTSGYSYFIQEYGSAVWDCASNSPITKADTGEAKKTALERLDVGFFRSRWDRATDAQKKYMRAMSLDDDGFSATSELAVRLNLQPGQIGPRRAELIAKGLIYSPGHGYVAFTVPYMANFIKRQLAE
jgi:hypothetical protein